MNYEVEPVGKNGWVVVDTFDRTQVSEIFNSYEEASDYAVELDENYVTQVGDEEDEW